LTDRRSVYSRPAPPAGCGTNRAAVLHWSLCPHGNEGAITPELPEERPERAH